MIWHRSFVSFLSFGFLLSVIGQEQKIETVLQSKWAPTSILLEAAEYIAEVDSGLFWRFVDNVLEKQGALPMPGNDEGETDLASICAFNLLTRSSKRLMEWALSSRAYSPRVVMLQQMKPNVPEGCDSFVHFGGDVSTCNLNEVKRILDSGKLQQSNDASTLVIDADHKYPSFIWTKDTQPVAILYGQLSSPTTKMLHEYLKSQAHRIGYVFRPFGKESKGKMALSGYGVELQFKSTEYKAQDDSVKSSDGSQEVGGFVFDKLHALHPGLMEKLDRFQNHLASIRGKKSEFEALKAWQVQELGLQASYFTTLQENFIEALLDVSGNFPSRASSLSSIRIPNDVKKSITFNQRLLQSHFNIEEGEGAFFLQGNFLDPDSMDLFAFQETLKSEVDLVELLKSTNHDKTKTRADVDAILSMGSKSNTDPDLALDLRDASVVWVNDLEKDEEYEDWPEDLSQLFFRMGGVMLRPVRRNVFNLLLTLNPDDDSTTGAMIKLAQSFMAHRAPVRIGVVFCNSVHEQTNSIEEPRSDVIRRILNYAVAEGETKKVFDSIVEAYSKKDFSGLNKQYIKAGEEYDFGKELSCDFVKKSGRPVPAAFLNGVPLKWDSVDDFEEIVLNQLLREAQSVQIDAFNGKVGDDTDIFEYLMSKPHVQTRLNDKILDVSNAKYLSFGTEVWEPGKDIKNSIASIASSLNYLTSTGKRVTPASVTMWVLADVETTEGRVFLHNAVEFMYESAKYTRLAFIPTSSRKTVISKRIYNAIVENDLKELRNILKDTSINADNEVVNTELNELDNKIELLLQTVNFPCDRFGVIVNGRLIGPLKEGEQFDLGDWSLIEKFTYDSCAKHLDNNDMDADSIMRICAALGNPGIKARNVKRFTMPSFESAHQLSSTRKDSSDPYYIDLVAVIDPASRHAHKMASILSAVQHSVGQWLKIQVIFNPPAKHSELPLKSYYRYVAGERANEKIVFEQIPKDPLFTQNLIAPDNWMVEVVKGENDLDNIRLRELKSSVLSQYELEYLLVEGHCLEAKTGSPPRGLQFTLTPETGDARPAETIVMANLGYFQLKAEPGVWKLGLRPGPSKEIFSLEGQTNKQISVQSFQSVVVKVKVKRNPGQETTSLLDSEEDSKGWFGFGGKNEADDDVINIFSLASGHLYERLLKIMMLSVLKNTKSKVKFWFLKNYLSPTFKDILPDMSKEYGFDYELVHYHWPRWLNSQREKQRIIWGYKILFLDVLFPLSLKKFIFVDADQIVRADMKELVDLDLEGNPYGYVPFCDSRTEMEGFRFWKQGYWKSHLGKRKYHISALYVVDLVRFRRIAAGDRLRGQYQALSQDPNSLSNLDQDLPNNMIHQVGIKSLPQEWCYCETWCDEASKAQAKTIDLCNNPQTKEPKLDAAQRIAPEWKGFDDEIREFQNRILKSRKHDEL